MPLDRNTKLCLNCGAILGEIQRVWEANKIAFTFGMRPGQYRREIYKFLGF